MLQVLLRKGAANYGGFMLSSNSYDMYSSFSVKLQSILQNWNKNTGNGTFSKYKNRIWVIGGTFLLLLLLTTHTCRQPDQGSGESRLRVCHHQQVFSVMSSSISNSGLLSQSNFTLSTFSSIQPKWRSMYQLA